VFTQKIGARGLDELLSAKPEKRVAKLREFTRYGVTDGDTSLVMDALDKRLTKEQLAKLRSEVSSSTSAGRSNYELENSDRINDQRVQAQRNAFSDETGLSISSIVKAVLSDPKSNALNTPAAQLFALDALKKSGMGGSDINYERINFNEGVTAKTMASLRAMLPNDSKGISIHNKLGFNTEDEMIAASKDPAVARRIRNEIMHNTDLVSGGTYDSTYVLGGDQRENLTKLTDRFNVAIKMQQARGANPTDRFPDTLQAYVKTGLGAVGDLGDMNADFYKPRTVQNLGAVSVYSSGINGFTTKDNHVERLAGIARDVAQSPDAWAKVNELSGNKLLSTLESQLNSYSEAKKDKQTELKFGEGGAQSRNIDDAITELTRAIELLKTGMSAGAAEQKGPQIMHVGILKYDSIDPPR
jgi:hypothetical protein